MHKSLQSLPLHRQDPFIAILNGIKDSYNGNGRNYFFNKNVKVIEKFLKRKNSPLPGNVATTLFLALLNNLQHKELFYNSAVIPCIEKYIASENDPLSFSIGILAYYLYSQNEQPFFYDNYHTIRKFLMKLNDKYITNAEQLAKDIYSKSSFGVVGNNCDDILQKVVQKVKVEVAKKDQEDAKKELDESLSNGTYGVPYTRKSVKFRN